MAITPLITGFVIGIQLSSAGVHRAHYIGNSESLLTSIVIIVLGIVLLVWSSDKFVIGAASIARNLGMSPLLIGITVVSLGTSAPEILVSLNAALVGASGLAVGNALGSNIANIALVLGVTAIVARLPVRTALIRKEFPILIIVTLLAGFLLWDQELSRADGVVLLLGLVVTLTLLIRNQPKGSEAEDIIGEEESLEHLGIGRATFWFITGLILLIASSRALVWGATSIATTLGVSDLIIGLTIVAIGTSLPELAASITSALKGHHDIALGNVIGSNIFNLLAVMSIPGIIDPYAFAPELLWRDFGLMAGLTLLLVIFAMVRRDRSKPNHIGRSAGILFVGSYLGYMSLLYFQA